MKTLLRSAIFFILSILFVFNSAQAAPQWVDVHGTNFVVEYPANTLNTVFYKGWGLDFVEKQGVGNWVHSSIPISGAQQARYIFVRYYKSSTASSISVVDVYNGETKIQTVVPPVGAAGWNIFNIDLGSFKSFNYGLGISLGISAPSNLTATRFIFSDAAAYYQ